MANGAVVHAKPNANDHIGKIIAAGWERLCADG
jgi:hypothetical protein